MRLSRTLGVLFGTAVLFVTGCGTQPTHPNQINTFDGAAYDSLTAAHSALVSLRPTIAATYPQYVSAFNEAAASYAVAYNAYAAYRSAPTNEAAMAVAISNLSVSIVSLEDAFQADLHVPAQKVLQIRQHAVRLKAAAAQQNISISDILTELEIAATIAESVPGTQPYSTVAAIVIKATQSAVAALSASSGQLIDLSTIQPVASI